MWGMLLMVRWHAQETPKFEGSHITKVRRRQLPVAKPPTAVEGRREGRKEVVQICFQIQNHLEVSWLWCDHTEQRMLGSQGQAAINKWDLGKAPFGLLSTIVVHIL